MADAVCNSTLPMIGILPRNGWKRNISPSSKWGLLNNAEIRTEKHLCHGRWKSCLNLARNTCLWRNFPLRWENRASILIFQREEYRNNGKAHCIRKSVGRLMQMVKGPGNFLEGEKMFYSVLCPQYPSA